MSHDPIKMSKTTPMQFLTAVLGSLFPPLFAIILIAVMVTKIEKGHAEAPASSMDDTEVEARIHPIGTLVAADPNAVHIDMQGEQVFNAVCTACHTPGALGAPKFGNKAMWGPRIKQGYATLISHAENGIRQMPPRGGNPDLTDLEIERAVAYMADAGGAKFTPPAAPTPAAPATSAAPTPAPTAAK